MCQRCAWRSRASFGVDGTQGSGAIARDDDKHGTGLSQWRAASPPCADSDLERRGASPFILPYSDSHL
jgi:hypothetical protein